MTINYEFANIDVAYFREDSSIIHESSLSFFLLEEQTGTDLSLISHDLWVPEFCITI